MEKILIMEDIYQALFRSKEEESEEVFNLGKCFFETDQDVDPLEHIKQSNFFGLAEMENLHFLFENLPVRCFDYKNRHMCRQNPAFKELYFMVCVYDMYNWCCHQAAPYFSVHNTGWNYMFGFAQQKLSNGKIHTFLHSFNAKGEIFVDPTIQASYQQQAWWVNKGILKKTLFKPKDIYRYIGIHFPTDLANKIVFEEEKEGQTGNVWGYLIREVLYSREKTLRFVNLLKTQGG